MCGRYTAADPRRIADAFPEISEIERGGLRRFNISPTDEVLAVVARDGARRAKRMRWGLVPHWAKDASGAARMINARAESVFERPAYRELVADVRSRCLVLADGFYEWLRAEDAKRPRLPVRFTLPGEEPFAFAGLCTTWRPPGEGERLRTCTILTTSANAVVAPLHDRMPVILADDESRAAWLDADADVPALLRPLPDHLLHARRANPRMNASDYEEPDALDGDAPQPEDPQLSLGL